MAANFSFNNRFGRPGYAPSAGVSPGWRMRAKGDVLRSLLLFSSVPACAPWEDGSTASFNQVVEENEKGDVGGFYVEIRFDDNHNRKVLAAQWLIVSRSVMECHWLDPA